MGYLSCNAESAVAICADPYNWDHKKKKKKEEEDKNNSRPPNSTKRPQIREFTCADLESATNGFSADSFLGKGSHGSVYRAVLDGGNLIAAVKKTTSASDTNRRRRSGVNNPADNEIDTLSCVRSPRLVNLLGFSADPKKKTKWIVVELMPNGSLYDLIHSNPNPPGLTRRVKLALQVAKAVDSLHSANPPVIHRDIKSSNVLLDAHWNARLGDFGLALRGHVEDVRVKCTPPAGTLGYLDPAYLAPGDLTSKSDVFSFGILLLEILSGRRAIDLNFSPPSVVDWAVPLIRRADFAAICDPRIGHPADAAQILRPLAVLCARCVRSTAEKRPSMGEVVECLKVVKRRMRLRAQGWSNLKRRLGCAGDSTTTSSAAAAVATTAWNNACEDEPGKASSMNVMLGCRSNSKVSDVPIPEQGHEGESLPATKIDRVVRSRSVGCGSDRIEMLVKRRPSLAVKMTTMALTKSRSAGVSRAMHCNGEEAEEVAVRLLGKASPSGEEGGS